MTPKPLMLPPGKNDTALLGALCLFLSAVEYLIPKPLPFMRMGLANLPLVLALDIFSFRSFLLLVSLKALGQALITGTLFSYVFLFSLAGTAVSALSMYALRRLFGKQLIGFTGLSVFGALLSNGVQLVLARFFVFGAGVRYIAPPFLAAGLITGIALGLFCEYFARRSRWYAARSGTAGPGQQDVKAAPEIEKPAAPKTGEAAGAGRPKGRSELFRLKRESAWLKLSSGRALALAGFLSMPALLFNPNTKTRVIQFLFFFFLAWLAGKKTRPLITLTAIGGIVLFNLLVPYGEILFSLGPLKISSGALLAGIRRAVTMEGLLMISRVSIRPDLRLPGSFGALTGETLRLFARLSEMKNRATGKNLAAAIDGLLFDLDARVPAKPAESAEAPAAGTSAPGFIILAAALVLAWIPWLFQLALSPPPL